MKKLLFLMLFSPSFLSAQNINHDLPYWFKQIRVGIQHDWQYIIPIGSPSHDDFFGGDIRSMDIDAQSGFAITSFMDVRLTPNFGIKAGIGFGIGVINASILERNQFGSPGSSPEVGFLYRSKFATYSIPFSFYFSKEFNKSRIYSGIGAIIQSSFKNNAEIIQISGSASFFSNRNNDGASYGLTASLGYFISQSSKLEIFIEPKTILNLNKVNFNRWKNRFFSFGISVGANFRVK